MTVRHYLGIDGEGQDVDVDPRTGRGTHHYVYLACSDGEGKRTFAVENKSGLSTRECLDFILSLPTQNTKVFAYSFGYDLTKILSDVDNVNLYYLTRPNIRPMGRAGPLPVAWRGYRLNLQGSKFTVSQGKKRVVVWDIFKFFQGKFVAALKDWKVGSEELLREMQFMKDKRGEFNKLRFEDVKNYCLSECRCMAQLAQKLTEAHDDAGLKLKNYYGAGSSAAAMLQTMGIRTKLRLPPTKLEEPVRAAFFGGRFENSRVGSTRATCYNYDISSAYPYQCTQLPCLEHGAWVHVKRRSSLDKARFALVRYGLGDHPEDARWGPFPYRTDGGNICFPIESPGGWVYLQEYLVGERAFPHVQFKEAWVYRQECACKPFERIAAYYRERLRIGKEGPGIVLKLGCNSCYGKLAQSIGSAPFNSWLWAGMITSGCRAQLLELFLLHKDMRNILMVATDGLCTTERLFPPKPEDTDTWDCVQPKKDGTFEPANKPLGGWEEKILPRGIFLARPGIYFPMEPTEQDIKDVRGRGMGKGTVLENWKGILAAYEATDWTDPENYGRKVKLANVSRFCGIKSSIHRSGIAGKWKYTRAEGGPGEPRYGQWISRVVEMSFDPMPKRESIESDGTLTVRRIPSYEGTSRPYKKAVRNEETEIERQAEDIVSEQPDGDLSAWL